MNTAPIPAPAPFTCPHCGAGVEGDQEFCPRCGARLRTVPQSGLSIPAIIGLAFGLLVFGGIGACGGLVTVSAFGAGAEAISVMIFSIPLFLIGLAGFIACLRPFFNRTG